MPHSTPLYSAAASDVYKGQLLSVGFIAQAGGAIFDNLALIFAIGVASSWSKDSAGAAALSFDQLDATPMAKINACLLYTSPIPRDRG